MFKPYLEPRLAEITMMRAENVRKLLVRAASGEELTSLGAYSNRYDQLALAGLGQIAVPLGEYDRGNNDERRAEGIFRTRLLPAVLESVSDTFLVHHEAEGDEFDPRTEYLLMGELEVSDRSIHVVRNMQDAANVEDPTVFADKKLLPYNAMPGTIIYRMIVVDMVPPTAPNPPATA